jgi:outer membrane protein
MKKVFLFLLLVGSKQIQAQNKWNLQQCIDYAVAHNISIQQSMLSAKLNEVQVQQNKYGQYPSVNADFNNGISVGRSVDPTSNSFINQAYYFNGLNLNASALVFGWFAKKYQRQQSQYDLQASIEQNKQLQNDLGLNIATGYLRVLLAKEQVKINEIQLQTDAEQYTFTRKRVNAGQLPELNAAQLYAQLVTDSSNVINSKLDVNSALLDLKSLLTINMQDDFDIQTPSTDKLQIVGINTYPSPEQIYAIAKTKRPQLATNDYKIKSAAKQVEIAKTVGYPTLSIGGNLGTNYASTVKSITGVTPIGEEFVGNIKVADSTFAVTRPSYKYTTALVSLPTQYDNNFRQTFSLGLNIPIFNGYNAKLSSARAKIGLQNATLAQQQEQNVLQQNVYKAYNDAQSSIQKYKAAVNTEKASAVALDYAIKRYNAGMLNTQEYVTQQNTLSRSKVATLLSQYDAIFKLKILDFYLGNTINL